MHNRGLHTGSLQLAFHFCYKMCLPHLEQYSLSSRIHDSFLHDTQAASWPALQASGLDLSQQAQPMI